MSDEILTELFLQKLDTEKDKVAETASTYVRTRLREISFSRKILTPEYVTKADCQRSVNHEQLVKIVDIEPNSKAMAINFRGRPDASYVIGTRYEIPFYKVSSPEYQKQEDELLSYESPILDLIERHAVVDIQTIEDEGFITRVESALATSGKYSTCDASWTTNALPKQAFVNLINTLTNPGTVAGTSEIANSTTTGNTAYKHNFEARRYKVDTILMNEQDFNLILLWAASEMGDNFATEITVNGYTYATLMGKKIIVTQKGELVPPGSMYAFAAKQFMGHSYILNDTHFWIDKRKDIITWSAYETIGAGIGNVYSIAKISKNNN